MIVRVGTSGFSYAAWKGSFYPAEIAPADMLAHYGRVFATVEINNTFYRMPRPQTVSGWAAQVGEDFRFAIKATRRITHIKRLRDVAEETHYLVAALDHFATSLGAVLFQLPPNFKKDTDRLEALLSVATSRVPTVLEFRHESWFCDEIYGLLSRYGAALCSNDSDGADATPLVATGKLGYIRLRRAEYSPAQLQEWARTITSQSWRQAFVYFKHEDAGSTDRAAALQALLPGNESPGDRT